VRETVRAACNIARYTAADSCAGLADPDLLARAIPQLDLYYPWELATETAIEMATTGEAAALDSDPRIRNSDGCSIGSGSGLFFYGNSNGFSGGYPTSRHSLVCSVIAQDDGGMQSNYWHTAARDHTLLEQPAAVGAKAAERALQRLGAQRLSTRSVPVLLIPEMARGLIGHFLGAIGGSALYRKASFLVDHAGRQIFPDYFNIKEDPHLPKAFGSAPFDGEGVATRARDLVRQGVLQGYILDSYSARRLGLQTTANAGGVHNIMIEPGKYDFEGLLKEMHTGLVVTQLMGQGVNTLTGDYSRGASGFWVENGEIRYPVEEITIAGNLRDMFQKILHTGNDIDTRSSIHCGSLLLDRMTVAGQ
jgi:PmbA protein